MQKSFLYNLTVCLIVKVTLLEAADRIGGRVETHYGNGWYADLGAMRIAPNHHIIHTVRLSSGCI